MRKLRDEILIRGDEIEQEHEQPLALGRWTRLAIVAGGAALALARLGGVAFAAGPDAGVTDRLALDATPGYGDDLALLAAPSAPAIAEQALAGPSDAKSSKSPGGKPSKGNEAKSAKQNGREDQSLTAKSPNNGTNVTTARTAQTLATPPSPVTPKTPLNETGTAHTPADGTTVKTPPTTTVGHEGDNGLHLGQLFHDGVNDQQAQAILDAMGGGSGLTPDDVKAMSLGELLQTAHAAGLSTEDIATLLDQHQEVHQDGEPHGE